MINTRATRRNRNGLNSTCGLRWQGSLYRNLQYPVSTSRVAFLPGQVADTVGGFERYGIFRQPPGRPGIEPRVQ